jgi:transposase-like protein
MIYQWVSDYLLLYAKLAILQLKHDGNKLHVDEVMITVFDPAHNSCMLSEKAVLVFD